MEDVRLDAIVDYNMDLSEARAYKLLLLWLDMSRTMFPDYSHTKMKKEGDPRKCQIFKYCYKLQRETQGILEEKHYPLYIRAQLEILKHLTKNNAHALIDPNCLVGEKAWIRWKMWKKKYDACIKSCEKKVSTPNLHLKVADSLQKTKEFLVKTFGSEITLQKFQEALINKNLNRWINMGKISPYYLVFSPLIAQLMPNLDELVNFDLDIYREALSPETQAIYNKIFTAPQ